MTMIVGKSSRSFCPTVNVKAAVRDRVPLQQTESLALGAKTPSPGAPSSLRTPQEDPRQIPH